MIVQIGKLKQRWQTFLKSVGWSSTGTTTFSIQEQETWTGTLVATITEEFTLVATVTEAFTLVATITESFTLVATITEAFTLGLWETNTT